MGLLDLDDPVAKHLKGFAIDNVTIRHLLNQTSGIPDDYMSLAEQHRETLGEVLTISDMVNLVKQYSKLEHPPGSVMVYSNTNYLLLAGIVEAVSEVPFEQFNLPQHSLERFKVAMDIADDCLHQYLILSRSKSVFNDDFIERQLTGFWPGVFGAFADGDQNCQRGGIKTKTSIGRSQPC